MRNGTQALAQQLTGKATLEECSLEEVKRIAQRYPYFAPAQFLLLQKLRLEGTPEEAEAQYSKAVLYSPDPLQFDFFIAPGNFYLAEEAATEMPGEVAEPLTPDLPLPIEEQFTSSVETLPDEAAADEPLLLPEPELEPEPLLLPSHGLQEVAPVEAEEQENERTGITPEAMPVLTEIPVVPATLSEVPPVAEPAPDEHAEDTIDTPEPAPRVQETNAQSKPADATPGFSFEPYHTVDYFASQGIRVAADELPKDKLGKQLKSFTEWLKTMKRLPSATAAEQVETAAEKKVETLADRSISQSEIVTETMAEVWAKQGAREKALEIYNKLVLQNPSKKAYFAAKIEHLKQS